MEVDGAADGGLGCVGDEERVTCSVCYGCPVEVETAMVPDCSHTFCASCIVGWSRLKQLCPLCKCEFSSVLVRRDASGNEIRFGDDLGWTEVSVAVMQHAAWLELTELRSVREDILSSFSFGPISSDLEAARLEHARRLRATMIGGSGGVQAAALRPSHCVEDDDDSVDDDDDAMWHEEQDFWEKKKGASRLTSSAGRRSFKVVLGNRPNGAGGFMRDGRANARPIASASSSSACRKESSTGSVKDNAQPHRTSTQRSSLRRGKDDSRASLPENYLR